MPWTTLTLQVTTPLFNGGADPADEAGLRPADEAGVRVASIRGAMRFWFRALAGAYTGPDVELLAALERRVFGGVVARRGSASGTASEAAVASPLIIRLPRPPELSYESSPDFLRGNHSRWIAYLLGLGLMEMKGSRPHLTRPFVPPGPDRTFDLKIRFQHDRQATDQVRQAVESLALASLWLTCTYGGIGARTRRGFGGVRILGGEGDFPAPWSPRSIRTYGANFYEKPSWVWPQAHIGYLAPHLRALAAAERRELTEPDSWASPPSFPVLSRRFAPAALAQRTATSWEEALAYGGRQLRLFRANRPQGTRRDDLDKRRRAQVKTAEWDDVVLRGEFRDFPLGALGLPVGFHDKDRGYDFTVNAFSAAGNEQLRRASPLWLRPVGADGQWRLYSYAFQGRFLPDGETETVQLLPGETARHAGWSEEELFVNQDDVMRLTTQWLATMRNGGDYATTTRD